MDSSGPLLPLLTTLCLLSPLALLWLSPASSTTAEPTPLEEKFQPPPKPIAPPALVSSLLVAKLREPAASPIDMQSEALSDAAHDDADMPLTGTLAEIEVQLAREQHPRPENAKPKATGARHAGSARVRQTMLRGCAKECREERVACGRETPRFSEARQTCQAEYKDCAKICRAAPAQLNAAL